MKKHLEKLDDSSKLLYKELTEADEKVFLKRYFFCSFFVVGFYVLLNIGAYLHTNDQAYVGGVIFLIVLLVIFAVSLLIRDHLIRKNYVTIVFFLSLISSFFGNEGYSPSFALDFINQFIFTFLLFNMSVVLRYISIYIIVIGILFALEIMGEIQLSPAFILFTPTIDHIIAIATRLILTINMVLYFKNRQSKGKIDLLFKNAEVNELNKSLNQALNALEKTQQQVIQSEKMASIGTFTAGIAHELNNPVNFLNGGLHLLESSRQPLDCLCRNEVNRDNDGIRLIREGSVRITNIVKALSTYSFAEKGCQVKFDLHEIIENVLILLTAKMSSDVIIQRNYQIETLVEVVPDKMHHVFLSILDNALFEIQRYPGDKKLFITTCLLDNYSEVVIYNTGSHIIDENLPRIFDPFFTTKELGDNVGLGLSIAYNIIKEHNGEIRVNNETDGVSFTVRLPVGQCTSQVIF